MLSFTLLLPSLLPSAQAAPPVPAGAHAQTSVPAPAAQKPATVVQTGTLAIVGARLEIGDGTTVENGTIVVQGGRILALGAGLAAPSGATVVDGKGLTIFPGFVDAYSTEGLKLPDAPANVGPAPDTLNTAPATMWAGNRKGLRADVVAAKAIDPAEDWTARAREGVTTVLLSGGNGSLAGTAALVNLTGGAPTVLDPEAGEEFVFRSGGGRGGADSDDMAGAPRQDGPAGPPPNTTPPGQGPQTPGQVPGQTPGRTPGQGRPTPPTSPSGYAYPGTLFGVVALVRQTLWDARAYAGETNPKPAVDPTYEALRPLVAGRMPGIFTIANSRDIARAARLSSEFGFRFIVNGVGDAYRMVDVLKARQAPVILSLNLPVAPAVGPATNPLPARVLESRKAEYAERLANARVLDAAGVPIAFRSGSEPYLVGVRKYVAASGLPRAAALRAMTLGAARIFGAEDQIGTLAVGKRANLVLMTGDFLDEKSTIRTTYVDGVETAPKKADPPPTEPAKTDPPKTGTTPPPATAGEAK